MTFSVARLAIIELSRVLRVKEVIGAMRRLTSGKFIRMKNGLKASGLELVEQDAEARLAKFRATYEPFLGGLAKCLMVGLPRWIHHQEQHDNWEEDARGATTKRLVEAVMPQLGHKPHIDYR